MTVLYVPYSLTAVAIQVIDAIKFNAGKMIQTFLLGLLVMYLWLLIGIWLLYDQHAPDMCTNMFQCFSSYFYLTMRGDGVKVRGRERELERESKSE